MAEGNKAKNYEDLDSLKARLITVTNEIDTIKNSLQKVHKISLGFKIC